MINELVQDNRTNGNSNSVDTGEFIELYNAGATIANIGGWAVSLKSLDSGGEVLSIPIPAGTMLAPGDYYVIGNSHGIFFPLIDLDTMTDNLFPNDNNVYELRDQTAVLVDALGVQLAFDPQYDFATDEQRAQIGGGGWSQLLTTVETPQSYGRYIDGDDTNNNGRDFGVIRSTPGASNTLPLIANAVPDVDALGLALGSTVPGFSYSFVGPKVVDPTVTSAFVRHALPSRSPQGGNAIAAWDETGGGNMVASDSLVNSFDIWAWIDTEPLNVLTGGFQWDATTYGIGTTDSAFTPLDPTAIFTTAQQTTNGNTGIGWVYLREESTSFESLMLIDFNDGGNSLPTAVDWTVLETIDLTATASDWHQLSIDYDPLTGEVVARYDEQVFIHNIGTEVIGTFYVGYRESLSGGVPFSVGPPIFDVIIGLPGDYNQDGFVNAADYVVWRENEGTNNPLPNDAIGGAIGPAHYNQWRAHFGQSAPSSATAGGSAFAAANLPTSAAVPEPTTLILLLFAARLIMSLGVRRRGLVVSTVPA